MNPRHGGGDNVTRKEALAKLSRFVVLTGLAMLVVAAVLGVSLNSALGQEPSGAEQVKPGTTAVAPSPETLKYRGTIVIAIAVLVAGGSVGAGFAVASVGSAALGAVTERPEMMGRALIFVALAEGIAIYGLLMAFLLMPQLK